MQLKQLFADEDAVSPVIGVILMVAITVILAAVIGTFVLGLGDNVQDNGPTANFQFSYNGMSDSQTGTMDITHNGGQNVEANNVVVNIAGTELDPTASGDGFTQTWPATISTGDKLTYSEDTNTNFNGGDEVRIIWSSPSGGSSSTIGQSQIPN